MSGRRPKPRQRTVRTITAGYPKSNTEYNPKGYPEDQRHDDHVVGVLGPPIDGWLFELVYRYAIYRGLNVDWAIMINARRADDGSKGERRNVLRIDICHSEVHRHIFKQSSDPADDLGIRQTIMSLSNGDAAKVSRQYDDQMAAISRTWERRVREWIDG
jgi:hypothetical protein